MLLEQKNSFYILLSSDNNDSIISYLYGKEYQVIPIKSYFNGVYGDAIMAFCSIDNNDLRKDILFILNNFGLEFAIIKYKGETEVKKIFNDGSEKPLEIVMYNTDPNNISFIHDEFSFSFVEGRRYWKPTKKEDFKVGMLVEYFSVNKWTEKKVQNPNDEYEDLYKLLIKYDKVRVVSKI